MQPRPPLSLPRIDGCNKHPLRVEPTSKIFVSINRQTILCAVRHRSEFRQAGTAPKGVIPEVRSTSAPPDRIGKGKGTLATTDTRKKDAKSDRPSSKTRRGRDKGSQGHVGDALRSVYQQTVDEAVPQDFLDMLDKLT